MRTFIFAFCFFLFSFMNAIFIPGKQYKVGLHRIKSPLGDKIRVYASTQMYIQKFGRVAFRHVHWGVYDEEKNLFIPNKEFITLDPTFKKQLIFPEYWYYVTDETDDKFLPINKINPDYKAISVEQTNAEKFVKDHFEYVFDFLKKYIG